MRIVFMGTGDIGLPTLQALLDDPGHEVVGVVTQPDKPVGRKQVMTPPKVKTLALERGVPVLQPTRVRAPQALSDIENWKPEVIAVMAYGQLLPRRLLAMPSVACLNLHASLLPRHRGAAPIQAAIRDGDACSGITVMHIAEGLDTGDMLLKRSFELAPDETGGRLHDRLAAVAPAALAEALQLLAQGDAPREVQDEGRATHTGKLLREDGVINWTQSAASLERLIRAFDPWPGTFTWLGEGEARRRLKIFPPTRVVSLAGERLAPGTIQFDSEGQWLVATGTEGEFLAVSEIQLEGKRRVSVAQFSQGHEVKLGTRLGALSGSE